MKNTCNCELRKYMSKCLSETWEAQRLSQVNDSERPMIDVCSNVDPEHGECLCCGLTLVLYLTHCCKDKDAVLEDMKDRILKAISDERPAS